jgi:hypothetical protein
MRWAFVVLSAALLAACGERAPNVYPDAARTHFEASCPPASAVSTCTWERITQTVTYEEYEAALQRFRETGLMEPRITRARTACIERHRE